MKIWKYLKPDHIFLDICLSDKLSVIQFIADAFARSGVIKNADLLYKGIKNREDLMSTGIGGGIGIPHTSSPEAVHEAILLIKLDKSIDFNALDNLPVDIILAIVVPENKTALHLQILAGISRLCRIPEFLKNIRQAKDSEKLLEAIKAIEEGMAFH